MEVLLYQIFHRLAKQLQEQQSVALVSSNPCSHVNLASLAVEVGLPQPDALAGYGGALLPRAFPVRSLLHLDAIGFAEALDELHGQALARLRQIGRAHV